MAFIQIVRPAELLEWMEPAHGNSGNATGVQGAHIIARNLWNAPDLENLLGLGDETTLNGVLAPETTSGGTILGYGTHRGQQLNAYDAVFYDPVNPMATEKLPDRKSKDVKLHPIIKKTIEDEVLAKMGAREMNNSGSGSGSDIKTKIVKPKKKAVSGAKKVKAKKVVN